MGNLTEQTGNTARNHANSTNLQKMAWGLAVFGGEAHTSSDANSTLEAKNVCNRCTIAWLNWAPTSCSVAETRQRQCRRRPIDLSARTPGAVKIPAKYFQCTNPVRHRLHHDNQHQRHAAARQDTWATSTLGRNNITISAAAHSHNSQSPCQYENNQYI